MTGTLAQIIAITAFGNDFLKNDSLPIDLDITNTTFQFCNKVDFREFKKQFFFSKPKERIVSHNPIEWFKHIKAGGCQYLRLYFKPSDDQKLARDYRMAGFVGGGGTWFIEAIYDSYSNYWTNRWEATNQNATDHKIWAVNYGATITKQRTADLQINNEDIKNKLHQSLTQIADFAYKQNLEGWGKHFDNAKATLDKSSPEEKYYHKDLVPLNNYSLTAKQILFTAGSAWAFGGMGSWSDISFECKEDNETYDRLSEQLYTNINNAIIAAINSY